MIPAALIALALAPPLAAAVLVWLPILIAPPTHPSATVRRGARPGAGTQQALTMSASAITLVASLALVGPARAGTAEATIWGLRLYLDALSIYVILLVNVVAVAASFSALPWWTRHGAGGTRGRTLFLSLFNLFHFTMILVPSVTDLVVLWIGIELTTVTSTALVAAEGRRSSLEAAWKYIVITSTGIIVALLGTIFLATSQGPGASLDWPDLVHSSGANQRLVVLSFLFVMVGYGTKAGLAPMHTWVPDAHGEAPYPVSALLSGVLLKSALYAILRFKMITDHALGDGGRFTDRVLLAAGLLSLVVSVPFIIRRDRIKRVLAYHSLEHMGIITLGLGISGPLATFGALLHLVNHGVTKSLMFLAYGAVQDNYASAGRTGAARSAAAPADAPSDTPDTEPRGVLAAMPWTGRCLALGGLALVGSPPFAIFLSELLILWGGMDRARAATGWSRAGWIAVATTLVLALVMIFAGLVRHLSRVLLGVPPPGVRPERFRQVVPLTVLLLGALLLGLAVVDMPGLPLRSLVSESAALVCGGEPCR
jgi:hydrogenase-4 component F